MDNIHEERERKREVSLTSAHVCSVNVFRNKNICFSSPRVVVNLVSVSLAPSPSLHSFLSFSLSFCFCFSWRNRRHRDNHSYERSKPLTEMNLFQDLFPRVDVSPTINHLDGGWSGFASVVLRFRTHFSYSLSPRKTAICIYAPILSSRADFSTMFTSRASCVRIGSSTTELSRRN